MKIDYEKISDDELTKLVNCDEKAMEEILSRYKGLVISLSRKYFLQGGELDDLISEGMLGLYKAALSYSKDKNATFSTYCYVCITRQLINAVKSSLSAKNSALNFSFPINQFENMSGGLSPEELFIYNEEEAKLKEKLRMTLSKLEFEILSLYLQGLSYDEISEISKTDSKSVDNALSRARKKIISLIGEN